MPRRGLVTGGASGIGLASSRRLMEDGLEVIAVDLSEEHLAHVAGEFTSVHQLDVANAAAVNSLISDLQPIDVLINSAGMVGPNVPIWEVDDGGWARTIAVNLTGTFNTMRAALPGMRERGWGRIVNVASIAGKEGNPNLGAYSA
ncbi:MAG: SDR family NAD(P)-dependent oxidoreductase, partial [Actinomycetia bacterium]|nr:SDR family NAD(P)-dependent oxidoreductase [Actinomycetes bacterium]